MASGREGGHVGADLCYDDLGDASANPRDRVEPVHHRPERAQHLLDLRRHRGDRLVEIVDVGQQLTDEESVVTAEATRQGGAQGRELRASPAAGELRQNVGSVVPATSALSIARPDTPRMSLATVASLMPASSSTLCSRLAWRTRSWVSVVRCAAFTSTHVNKHRVERLPVHAGGDSGN
jgi:hypothetical protein